MTNQEAIKILINLCLEECDNKKIEQALSLAIKSLEGKPTNGNLKKKIDLTMYNVMAKDISRTDLAYHDFRDKIAQALIDEGLSFSSPISRKGLEKLFPPEDHHVDRRLNVRFQNAKEDWNDGANHMRECCINALLRYWGRE